MTSDCPPEPRSALDGRLDVDSLVFATGPSEGTNTIPFFKAIVSCRTIENGAAVVSKPIRS